MVLSRDLHKTVFLLVYLQKLEENNAKANANAAVGFREGGASQASARFLKLNKY